MSKHSPHQANDRTSPLANCSVKRPKRKPSTNYSCGNDAVRVVLQTPVDRNMALVNPRRVQFVRCQPSSIKTVNASGGFREDSKQGDDSVGVGPFSLLLFCVDIMDVMSFSLLIHTYIFWFCFSQLSTFLSVSIFFFSRITKYKITVLISKRNGGTRKQTSARCS